MDECSDEEDDRLCDAESGVSSAEASRDGERGGLDNTDDGGPADVLTLRSSVLAVPAAEDGSCA